MASRSKISFDFRLGDAALDAAAHEAIALGVHLRLDLLAHGAAQQVGLAQRIAGQDLGDLHHLFLVDDDAERLLQHRLHQGMDVIGRRVAVLHRAIQRNVGHRTGTVERHQRDDVLQPVGAHFGQRLAHARAFHLEHAHRLAAPEHVVGALVVERDLVDLDVDAALREQVHRGGQRRQRLQAEEVELHEARRLDPFHVELGGGHVGARIAIERHELFERAVADDDAGRVRGGVGVEPFELLGDVDERLDLLVAVARLAQTRLAVHGLRQRDGRGGVLRHELGELVDLAQRHLQHAADVAHDAAREERAEGDDLRDAVGAVALAHVGDHLVAARLAEVDVEVGHRHAFGIEKALEQQAEAHRIEVGDRQRPGDERARARAAARARRGCRCAFAYLMKSDTMRK